VTPSQLADCVRRYVERGIALVGPDDWVQWISAPSEAWRRHATEFQAALEQCGLSAAELSAYVRNSPYLLLPNVFECAGLPATPQDWVPIPDVAATRAALAAVVLVAGACSMETVSYGSENAGALFVNLVTLPGPGAISEKSQGSMKGHTDAATFPFRGTTDPDFPRIAPSPDVVFLAALRNVDAVPTAVMPLPNILNRLSPEDAQILKGPNIILSAQRTFVKGTQKALGQPHVLDGAPVLHDGPEGTWVRYTHSQSLPFDENDAAAVAAKKNFEAACLAVTEYVVLKPGDLLLVNNRKALHGRSKVGPAVGGESRWLIRSYGLDCTEVAEDQRHAGSSHILYP
jgi:L-asparagine oxygenase